MFCHHLIGALHFGQCDGGRTIDSPRGTRQATTFRNEAIEAPSPKAKTQRIVLSSGSISAYIPAPPEDTEPMILTMGRNIATTMVPTTTASTMISAGSIAAVMPATALSTSSS